MGIKHLPVIPNQFELQPIEKAKADSNCYWADPNKEVETIVNACDAGREGELIFRYIMALAKVDKPLKRMWMQSMTDGAILEAFDRLREDGRMKPWQMRLCRSESDWLWD